MGVPGFQALMLPILRAVKDGQDHPVSALVESLSNEFGLTADDRDQRNASGQRTIFNRTHWAVFYLVKAGVLLRFSRGTVRMTVLGQRILADDPPRVDLKYLTRFPGVIALRSRAAASDTDRQPVGEVQQTPDELLDASYVALRRNVEADLLDRVLAASPEVFEQLVVRLLVAMGYGGSEEGGARTTKRSGDDGIDGVIDEDKLGLNAVYLQAKRWDPSRPVRRPDVQAFAGSLEGQRAAKGVFFTTSRFTEDAREYVGRISRRIVLIDGPTLARLMYDHGIAVRDGKKYIVRRVDEAYFEGEV